MTVTQRGLRGKTDTVSIECVFAFIPRMRVYQSVIDVHFCQFARLPNAIKADKLPLVVKLQPRRLVHGNASLARNPGSPSFLLVRAPAPIWFIVDWD